MEERRKSESAPYPFANEHSDRLARIETKLDNALSWLSKRDEECKAMQKELNTMQVTQGKQGTIIWLFSGMISAVIAGVISFFSRK
ncbi:MAG: hemolysin XhlA family protein [Candidatus Kuenenia sp.]|nr:hemolysin XhlA family protein [Candidatus Kuenenia sp.]